MATHTRFNRIYDQTFDRVRRYLYPRVRSPEDLSDLLQEIYLELYRALERNADPKNPEAFLIHIAKQKLAVHYHDEGRRPLPMAEPVDVQNANDLDRWLDRSIEDAEIQKILTEVITESLPTKPWPIRQIFTCIFALDMKMPEVAEALDLTVNQVRNLYYRTLKDLRARYAEPVPTSTKEPHDDTEHTPRPHPSSYR